MGLSVHVPAVLFIALVAIDPTITTFLQGMNFPIITLLQSDWLKNLHLNNHENKNVECGRSDLV